MGGLPIWPYKAIAMSSAQQQSNSVYHSSQTKLGYRRSVWVKYLSYGLLLAMSCLLCGFYYGRNSKSSYQLYYSLLAAHSADKDSCVLPRLDPWDSTILQYVSKPSALKCKVLQSELSFLDDEGVLHLNESALSESGYNGVICSYRCFDKTNGLDDVTIHFGEWTVFEKEAKITCEFVEVNCVRSSFIKTSVYFNLHSQILVNKTKVAKIRSSVDAKSPTRKPHVLLFVLDSVSHSNFIRALPKTFAYLHDNLEATIFDGMVKVGDNSLPNAVAFLTGHRTHEAGFVSELPDDMTKSYYDDWPIVWKDFSKENYVTFYAEDYPNFNLFYYLSNGFKWKPVDHYFRPFWHHLWSSWLHRRSTHLCFGNTPKHRLQLHYLRQFLEKYKSDGVPLFGMNWLTELGHDFMNQVALGDDDLASFFEGLASLIKENTILFVLSDHGHRFDAIRESVIGRVEERLPFFSVILPSNFRKQFPHIETNLRENSRGLTSFFDVYATLQDILQSDLSLSSTETFTVQKNLTGVIRGLSLFRPHPENRTCVEAGIPEEFCVCQHETIVNISDPSVEKAANVLLLHVNEMLRSQFPTQCAQLTLKEIKNAATFLPNMNMVLDPQVSVLYGGRNPSGLYLNYRVTIMASPSAAIFEGTLRRAINDEDSFTVIGDVNRINRYGNQSTCINSALLRKYCYCVV